MNIIQAEFVFESKNKPSVTINIVCRDLPMENLIKDPFYIKRAISHAKLQHGITEAQMGSYTLKKIIKGKKIGEANNPEY